MRVALRVALKSLQAYVWGAVLSAALVVVSMHVWATLVIAALHPTVPYMKAASHVICFVMYTVSIHTVQPVHCALECVKHLL